MIRQYETYGLNVKFINVYFIITINATTFCPIRDNIKVYYLLKYLRLV